AFPTMRRGNDLVKGLFVGMGLGFVERARAAGVISRKGYFRSTGAIQADPKAALADWSDASSNPTIRKLPAPVTLPADGKVYADAFAFEAEQAYRFGYLKQPADVKVAIDDTLLDEAAKRVR